MNDDQKKDDVLLGGASANLLTGGSDAFSRSSINSENDDQKKDDVLLGGASANLLTGGSDAFSRSSINSDVLNNIAITISVEVGRTSLKIKDLMRLTQGSVVELDRLAGEPLDLLVNNTLVAQGEVVLVNERYGVRLTQVIPAAERIKNI